MQLRKCLRMKSHLKDLMKAYNKEKTKHSRQTLLSKALSPDQQCLDSIKNFRRDKHVTDMLIADLEKMVRGYHSKTKYNTCLGLLSAYLIFR